MPIRTILALTALLLASVPLAAEEPGSPLTQEGQTLHLRTLGHDIAFPLPGWLTGTERLAPDVVPLVESSIYGDAAQAYAEFFPRGQSLNSFTTTYAARISLEPGRSLEDYRRATIYGYSQICKPEAMGQFSFGEDSEASFPALAVVCGAYRDVPGLAGMGEIALSVFRKTDAGIAVVYEEWRGPAFGTYQPETWPVSADTLKARAAELAAGVTLSLAD